MTMGNRAVICFDKYAQNATGIYLHWNGGRDSVEAFLEAARLLKINGDGDKQYAPARFVQMIGNFFGGTNSLGIGPVSELDCDNGDNGVYVVDSITLKIKERRFFDHEEEERPTYEEEFVKCVLERNKIFEEKP
jgi:hypothetical protein